MFRLHKNFEEVRPWIKSFWSCTKPELLTKSLTKVESLRKSKIELRLKKSYRIGIEVCFAEISLTFALDQ